MTKRASDIAPYLLALVLPSPMLLDDNPRLQGARVAGVPVVGPLARVREPSVTVVTTHVIVALTAAHGPAREGAVSLALWTKA